LANRFETRLCGFLDLVVSMRKKPKSHLDKVDQIINWKPIAGFLRKKLHRQEDAVGDSAYLALGMFKALLLQRWYVSATRAWKTPWPTGFPSAASPALPWTTNHSTPPPLAASATTWKNAAFWPSC
jgi:IS5 family transposase